MNVSVDVSLPYGMEMELVLRKRVCRKIESERERKILNTLHYKGTFSEHIHSKTHEINTRRVFLIHPVTFARNATHIFFYTLARNKITSTEHDIIDVRSVFAVETNTPLHIKDENHNFK